MKFLQTVCILLSVCIAATAGAQSTKYDSVLAKKLQADDYGMKKYVFVILKTGNGVVNDKQARDSIFRGHMKNIQRLAAENKLILAGPFFDNDAHMEGIFVFNTDSLEQTKAWLATDPAVSANLLALEMYVWYGTAALMEIPALHSKIQKKSF